MKRGYFVLGIGVGTGEPMGIGLGGGFLYLGWHVYVTDKVLAFGRQI